MNMLASGLVMLTLAFGAAWAEAPAWADDGGDPGLDSLSTMRVDSLKACLPDAREHPDGWISPSTAVGFSLAATALPMAAGALTAHPAYEQGSQVASRSLFAIGAIVGPSAGRLLAGGSGWWVVSRGVIVAGTAAAVATVNSDDHDDFFGGTLADIMIVLAGGTLLVIDAFMDIATTPRTVRAHNARLGADPGRIMGLVPAVSPRTGAAGIALRATF
ncbi:MAG: hypothetical protein HZB25_04005 [Candidatus Eisenbacteria bacterium]|nr:hypothetical protein [Candidatus Eisenbacteria bacterium]